MNVLPADWHWTTLGEVADVSSGVAKNGQLYPGPDSVEVPYLRVANVQNGHLNLDDVRRITVRRDRLPCLLLRNGDVLMNEGGDRDKLGRGWVWEGQIEPCIHQNHVFKARVREAMDPKFLSFYANSFGSSWCREHGTQSVNLASISRRTITSMPVPLPPIEVQRQVVTVLESNLSRLDAAVSYISAARRRLSQLVDGLLAAEYGAHLGTATAALPKVEGVDDSTLPVIPASWSWKRLGDLADVVGGVTKDAKKQGNPLFVEVPYLRVANVQRGWLDLTTVNTLRVPPATAESLRLHRGDVLLNEGGDRDKLGRGWVWEGQVDDCIHQNHVFRARVRDGALLPELLSHAANTVGGRWCQRNGTQSVNLASISLRKIKLMPVPVPPIGEQVDIAGRISERLAHFAHLESALAVAELRQSALRRGLFAAAFSGELSGRARLVAGAEESFGFGASIESAIPVRVLANFNDCEGSDGYGSGAAGARDSTR